MRLSVLPRGVHSRGGEDRIEFVLVNGSGKISLQSFCLSLRRFRMKSIDKGFLEWCREVPGRSIQKGSDPLRLRHSSHTVQGLCRKQISGSSHCLHLGSQGGQMTLGSQAEKVLQLDAVHRGVQGLGHRIGHVSFKGGQGGKGDIGLVTGKGGHKRFGCLLTTEDAGGADGRFSQFARVRNAAGNKGKGALYFFFFLR